MPKYLITASYSAEGLRGLQRDKASGRRRRSPPPSRDWAARSRGFYYALGEDDAYRDRRFAGQRQAAALGIAVSATGLVRTRTTALMTVEEIDRALEKTVNYRAPGRCRQQDAGCSQKVAPDCSQCRTISSPVANHTPACERM